MPWFMTVFGRDTIITCLQTLLLGPELARSALEELAELQATEDDPSIDAEPGKIVHEVRRGKATKSWFSRYYGTVDATPLYLVLLSEVWRWTDDARLVERAARAGAARARVDRPLRRPRRRRVRRVREAQPARASTTSRGRTPYDSQRFHDGRIARHADRAVRGAGLRLRREAAHGGDRARGLARPGARRTGSTARPRSCGARFDEAFWIEERGGYYALALDGDKQRVDSLCSNIGPPALERHRPAERADAVVDQLMGEATVVGLGRADDVARRRRLQPARVPQRHGLAPRQLPDRARARALPPLARGAAHRPARCSRRPAISTTSCRRCSPACREPRRRSRSPTRPRRGRRRGPRRRRCCCSRCCSASSRARQLDGRARAPRSAAGCELPSWVGSTSAACRSSVRVRFGRGVWRPCGSRADRRAFDRSASRAVHADRRSQLPVWFPVPPTGYGGIEWIVWLLADGLVDAGHDVTLFASGDSRTKAKLVSVYDVAPSELIGTSHRRAPPLPRLLRARRRVRRHQRPLGPAGRRARRCGRRRRRCTRCTARWTRSAAPSTSRSRASSPQVGLISISMNQRTPKPDLPWVANCPNALDLSLYPVKPHRGDYLLFLGRMSPDKGAHRAIAVAEAARAAAEDRGEEAGAGGAGVLRRVRRAAPLATRSSTSAR